MYCSSGRRLWWSAVAALALAGCSPSGENDPASVLQDGRTEDVLFLTQKSVPEAHMEALFEGRVLRDENGCLRLDSPDPATVVWPHGFTLRSSDGRLEVIDAGGVSRGTIGGMFRISGGETTVLSSYTTHDPAAAQQRCPGRFWIAGHQVESAN